MMTEMKPIKSNTKGVMNSLVRRLDTVFPGFFTATPHNHMKDFKWPDNVMFGNTYQMFNRNGLAKAAVSLTTNKTWETFPILWSEGTADFVDDPDFVEWADNLRFWQKVMEADKRSMVGKYSAIILHFADGKSLDAPVVAGTVGGYEGLVRLTVLWEPQISVLNYDEDPQSATYGDPLMFQVNEDSMRDGSATNPVSKPKRMVNIHPDRVFIWSKDGSMDCRSELEAGYNALLDAEKISGAGGEGFWKNARSAPVIEVDKEARISEIAKAMRVSESEVFDAMNDQVEEFQNGFDKLLMLQGMTAKPLGITMSSPEHYFKTSLSIFASSFLIPMRILIGSQTGERSSSEDAKLWAKTVMSRRTNEVIPNIRTLIKRLQKFKIFPSKPFSLTWTDLSHAGPSDKANQAFKMADINYRNTQSGGTMVYTEDEIREVTGHPKGEGLKKPEDPNNPENPNE